MVTSLQSGKNPEKTEAIMVTSLENEATKKTCQVGKTQKKTEDTMVTSLQSGKNSARQPRLPW